VRTAKMTKTMTVREVYNHAYREARQAGLDRQTSDAVAHGVVGRLQNMAGDLLDRVLRDEIQRHAAP
jgi:hypothetical protein